MSKNADTKFGSLSWIEIIADSIESPSSRIGHSLVYFEGNLYLFGGKDEFSASSELWQYHIDAAVWTKLSYSGRKPPRRFYHNSLLYDRKMFSFGGSLDSSFSLWVFDFDIYEWDCYECDESWPKNRHSQSIALLNDRAYMYGGYTYLGTESDELWSYDMEDNTWVRITATTASGARPSPMFGHSAVFNGTTMWIFGGSYQREILSDLWSYDTELVQWHHVVRSSCPPPLYYHIALVTGEVMLTYGGLDENVKSYGGMWKFNFETEDWTQMVSSELPPLAGHAVAVSYIKTSENGGENCIGKSSLFVKNKTTELNNKFLSSTINVMSNIDKVLSRDNNTNNNDVITQLDSATLVMDECATSRTDSFVSQNLVVAVTPGDIELRPITNRSTITFTQCSDDSNFSLPGMVLDDNPVTRSENSRTENSRGEEAQSDATLPGHICDASSPPDSQRIYHSVYENRIVSEQLETSRGFCVNNPLFSESMESEVSSREETKTITFYDNKVLGDSKIDHSDSGSQGSRSSLKKKKHYKRGFNTEFYIVGHGQETLPKSVALYRCKIG